MVIGRAPLCQSTLDIAAGSCPEGKAAAFVQHLEGSYSGVMGLPLFEMAEILARNHPKWQGYDIKHKIDVSFGYVSPVDGAWHTGNHQLSAFPDGRPLRAGDGLPILISKTKADKTRGA